MRAIVFAVAAGLVLFGALHVTIWRAAPSNAPRMLLLGALGAVGLAASVVTALALRGAPTADIWIVWWMDSFFLVFYAFVYAGIARSVSVTLLGRLAQGGSGSVPLRVLAGEYEQSSRFEDRLALMHRSGLIDVEGNVVTLTARGRRVVRWTERASSALASRMEG